MLVFQSIRRQTFKKVLVEDNSIENALFILVKTDITNGKRRLGSNNSNKF